MKYLDYNLGKVALQSLCSGDSSKAYDDNEKEDAFRSECV